MSDEMIIDDEDANNHKILVSTVEDYHKVTMNDITHALKLRRLVKEEIKRNNHDFKIIGADSSIEHHTQGLQYLIDESEK